MNKALPVRSGVPTIKPNFYKLEIEWFWNFSKIILWYFGVYRLHVSTASKPFWGKARDFVWQRNSWLADFQKTLYILFFKGTTVTLTGVLGQTVNTPGILSVSGQIVLSKLTKFRMVPSTVSLFVLTNWKLLLWKKYP